MPPQNNSEDKYQIATLVVATITGLVIIFYTIIFFNPRVAFNPFKPPLPTATLIAALPTLPPTWTPTEVSSPTTPPTSTATATLVVPLPTVVVSTATTAPTPPPTATPRPPTRTPAPTSAAPHTVIPAAYPYRAALTCSHSGGTQIKGTVSSGGQPQEGVRVRVATSPDPAAIIEGGEQFTRGQPDGSAGFAFVLKVIGAFDPPATWYVWIVDGTGNPLSDPNFHFQTNNLGSDNPQACWLAIIDFAR